MGRLRPYLRTRMERLAKDKHSNLILAYHKLTDVKFASYLGFNLQDIFYFLLMLWHNKLECVHRTTQVYAGCIFNLVLYLCLGPNFTKVEHFTLP